MPAVVDDQTLPRGALSGQVAVVVGGASGIGRTVANALARQGARVVIADFDSERMERTVEEILELGIAEALALTTDVRSDASVRSMADTLSRTLAAGSSVPVERDIAPMADIFRLQRVDDWLALES